MCEGNNTRFFSENHHFVAVDRNVTRCISSGASTRFRIIKLLVWPP